MHIDLEQIAPGTPDHSRFCIVGAGIAGLILARKLASFGFEVTVLEAGGLELEDRSQSLYSVEQAERTHTGSTEGRFRTFGGSSTRWGGQLLPYTDAILSPPDGLPAPTWPIATSELTPYYAEIQNIFQVGTLPFTDSLLTAMKRAPVTLSQLNIRFSKWSPFNRRNLAHTVGKDCLQSERIRLYTHANCASLHGDGSRITHARVLDYSGREFTFTADHFIVCCGTVESSRLLLSSPGVPNTHDQLGRYFHDHISFHAAVLSQAARAWVSARLGPFVEGGVLHTVKMEATPELQQQAELLAVMAHFIVEEPEDSGIAAVRNLLRSVQQGRLKEALQHNLLPMLRGAGDVAQLLWYSKVLHRRAFSSRAIVRMCIDMEQPATAANRIRLSSQTDALGLPKAIVDWRITDAEYNTAQHFAQILHAKFAEAGWPAFEWLPGLMEGVRPEMADTFHPMGGLRMGPDAAESVVDGQLKVHSLQNLYVASCAAFPSGGSSNPTFTLMALTLRLADHLRATAG